MKIMKMESPEFRVAELIWKNEPISFDELIKLCKENLSWNSLKTERELRGLYKKRVFQEQNGLITSMISYEDYCARLAALNNGVGKNQDSVIAFHGGSVECRDGLLGRKC